jgi:hypothetical protein
MGWNRKDLSAVAATVFAGGRGGGDAAAGLPGLILVSWRSESRDKLFQAYVNGKWAGATVLPEQRALLVEAEAATPAVIELAAVDGESRDTDYAAEVCGPLSSAGCRAVLRWPRRGSLPRGSVAEVFGDGGTGVIDYSVVLGQQAVWPDGMEKWGWGLEGCDEGDFGYSGSGAPGWGGGSFGEGEFGFDAEMGCFVSVLPAAGRYRIAVRLRDAAGNVQADAAATATVTADPLPEAARLAIESYEEAEDRLVLRIG